MTLLELSEAIKKLQEIKCLGGRRYVHITKLLESEAITDNIAEVQKILKENQERKAGTFISAKR